MANGTKASAGGRLRALTPAEHALDRARQSLLALGLEIDALAEGRAADVAEMRLACERLERDLAEFAGLPSAHDLNTRHALPNQRARREARAAAARRGVTAVIRAQRLAGAAAWLALAARAPEMLRGAR